jgi:hypothetical protein
VREVRVGVIITTGIETTAGVITTLGTTTGACTGAGALGVIATEAVLVSLVPIELSAVTVNV